MIRLILNPDSGPVEHAFDKSVVIIGAPDFLDTDLSLPGEYLEEVHIKIFIRDTKYTIINQANDPFVTLNGIPFGKRTLHDQDRLQVGNTLIKIRLDNPEEKPTAKIAHAKESWGDTAKEIPVILEKTMSQSNYKPPSTTIPGIEFNEYADLDIDELVRQVELLEAHQSSTSTNSLGTDLRDAEEIIDAKLKQLDDDGDSLADEAPLAPKNMQSLKDDYLKYLDDDSEIEIDKFISRKGQNSPGLTPEVKNERFNFFIKLFLIIVILAGIFCAYWYYILIETSEEEELRAARAVADISMALNYANFFQVRPQNQNWSDPDFLRSNLQAILSKSFKSMVNLDNQGKFSNTPYILRIYTSTDLTQFLVLAQPAPGWEQWIVPKQSIIVFSESMELRKTSDLRVLNRILLNTETLDGNSHHEIADFLNQSQIIPLKDIAIDAGTEGFAPPKALALFRPGSENYLYNAPRYFMFGESFVNRAIDLANNPDSVHEAGLFQQQIKKLSQYPGIVLYSSYGLKWATEAKKAISSFLPNSSVSTAYLQYNSKGSVIGSHLLFEDQNKEIAAADFFAGNVPTIEGDYNVDATDALSMQLQILAKDRQKTLTQSSSELVSMIQEELTSPTPDFKERFKAVFERYTTLSSEINKKITDKIIELEQDYSKIPLCDFLQKTEQSGLNHIAQPVLEKVLTPEEITCKTNDFEALLKKIDDATTFTTLHDAVKEVSKFLVIETIPDTQKLISYQGYAKGHVQKKLSQFLLSDAPKSPEEIFNAANRELLLSTLEMAWITDFDENNYYMQEFDLHIKEKVDEIAQEIAPVKTEEKAPEKVKEKSKKKIQKQAEQIAEIDPVAPPAPPAPPVPAPTITPTPAPKIFKLGKPISNR